MRLFKGNKSYFRYIKEKLNQLIKEDPNYFIISDSKQEFSIIFGTQGISINKQGVGYSTAGYTFQKSYCFSGFEVQAIQ